MTRPNVTIRTNKGDIKLTLYADKAPETVKNFLQYVDDKHYSGTIFHRVIDGFMVQGGGLNEDLKDKPTRDPIRNEADNRVQNQVGTVAMARTSEVHSATSQFFINVANNEFLDYRNPTQNGFGYCVFGEVSEGMDIVNQLKKVKTGTKNGHQDVPVETIKIIEVIRN